MVTVLNPAKFVRIGICLVLGLASFSALAASADTSLSADLENMDQQVHSDPAGVRAFLLATEPMIGEDDVSTRVWFLLRRAQAYNALFMYDRFERDIGAALLLSNASVSPRARLWLNVYNGLIMTRHSRLQRGVEILTEAAHEAEELGLDRVFVFAVQELAYTRGVMERYDESLIDLHRAFSVAARSNERDLVAIVQDAYGGVYAYMQDYERSLEYYRRALPTFEALGYKEQTASVILGLASTYRYMGNAEEAAAYYQRYLDFTSYAVGKEYLFYGNYGLAMTYAMKEDCERALPQIVATIGLKGPEDYKAELFKQQARCAAIQGNFELADQALQQASDIFATMPELAGTTWVLDLDEVAANIEFYRGNTRKAFELFREYHQNYKEQLEKSSSERMNMLRVDLESKRKDLQIAMLKQESQLNELQVSAQLQENQQQRYLIALFVVLSLVILIGLVVQRRNNQRVLALSHRDSLSGLYNHRYTFDYLERVVPQISVATGGLSIILMDIDDFKTINDKYGHPMGDAVIKRIAQIGEQSLRNRDIMGRIGGEEFLCVLPRATSEQSLQVAERLKDAISTEVFTCKDGSTFSTSISIGIASYSDSVTSADQLYSMADMAMYKSKKTGKNRITAYRPD
jgi:two-component system cell cycle response regulator